METVPGTTPGAALTAAESDAPSDVLVPSLPAFSPVRAWFYLVWLSIQRQARARITVWFALTLLVFTMTVVGFNTARGRWSMDHWRSPRGVGPSFAQWLDSWSAATTRATAASPISAGVSEAVLASCQAALDRSGFLVFSRFLVYSIFVTFLLPLWSLSFATEALSSEREARSLVWLLTRPMSRWSIYLAKFVALLPWALVLNVGGFGLICLVAGSPGHMAFRLYWPAILGATVAFCALFHLMSALFRRAVIIAIVYTFFLEMILGNMPGYLKRVSIGFYTRCLMFEAAEGYGVQPPEKASIYMPVDAITAWWVLLLTTLLLLAVGMWVFSRAEYRDES